ncbi:hypothetical protein SAMN04488118_103194 [Epibacterium ulvae]|uniref:Uncharacterized protein n=1 Tax=Epibacterium ulvae TaxID=1156985 RepID=A0A1G5Q961_9RHOB|nr:hypothetical protein [Epibacterium ulvae]SCZ58010.1 hypothetical protein SAMN04488118_103194 [Epibacterium ulvae]
MKTKSLNILFPSIATLIVAASPIAALVMQPAPKPGGVALVIAPPWSRDISEIIERAQIAEISPVRAPMGVLVEIENSQDIRNLRAHGAWLVLNGARVLELCAV